MSVRRASLEEWTYVYVHRRVWREGFFVAGSLETDVTAIAERFAGGRTPWTAIVLKALALTGEAHPAINRMVFDTVFGVRVVQFDRVGVALPVLVTADGEPKARMETVFDAHRCSLAELRAELSRLREKPPARHNLLRFSETHSNNALTRTVVRLAAFTAFNFPGLLEKAGGAGLALSSLVSMHEPGLELKGAGLSPAGLSLSLGGVTERAGRVFLPLGLCYNHVVCRGDEAYAALKTLWRLLSGQGPGGYAELLR